MAAAKIERAVLIVLDSVGCGELPDAAAYGDAGSNTLGNLARKIGGIRLPNLQALGLGNLTEIAGVPRVEKAAGGFGKMHEASAGKDTTTGHWEMAGIEVKKAFPTFPQGFPSAMIERFSRATGRGVLGNKTASGSEIIEELGVEHMKTGALIVYTSADSVFQIAAHEEIVPIDELYRVSEIARKLCDEIPVARVIARPFVGEPGKFKRTYNRRDFSMPPPSATVLDALLAAKIPVIGVGKIWDIFAGHGIGENIHSEGNADGCARTLEALEHLDRGLLFLNLVDFDMLYGHRRDPQGYGHSLEEFDTFLPSLQKKLGDKDLLILTADHGNDPTYRGTDHTREYVPLLALRGSGGAAGDLGVRRGFYDIAQSLADGFGLARQPHGESFLPQLG